MDDGWMDPRIAIGKRYTQQVTQMIDNRQCENTDLSIQRGRYLKKDQM